MSRTLRSNNSEFRKEQIGLNTSVERPAFSNPPLSEAAVMARAPSRQIPTCSQLLPSIDPLQHRVQRRTQRLTPRRETVFHLGRYFRIGLTHDDAVSLHGYHAFRRFRFAVLRKAGVPDDLIKLWLGHSQNLIDLYAAQLRHDDTYRRGWCERAGLGFELGELGYKLEVPIRPVLVA
jgi:hypothetical protein